MRTTRILAMLIAVLGVVATATEATAQNMVTIQGRIRPMRAEIVSGVRPGHAVGGGQWNVQIEVVAYYADQRTGRQVRNVIGRTRRVAGPDGYFEFSYPVVREYPNSQVEVTVLGGWAYRDSRWTVRASSAGTHTPTIPMSRR